MTTDSALKRYAPSGVSVYVSDAIDRLRAAGAPFDVVNEGLAVGHPSRPGRFGRMRLLPYTDRGAALVDRAAVETEERYWSHR